MNSQSGYARSRPASSDAAVDRLQREAGEVLAVLEVVRRYPSLTWLAEATDVRLMRLSSALDDAQRGFVRR